MMEFICCISDCSDQVIFTLVRGESQEGIFGEKKTIEVVGVYRRWKKEERNNF